ncbi:hypothetical protein [Trichloromonas sp.]|uniref:hypothetical protein n=1 Tax=Trichloromonas sp. TaxID=3069249 RepID=UPI002A432632|nr:hypothetical protein [Trichloromonas sp.]
MDRYYTKLISTDLIEVKPLDKPNGTLYYIYMDYTYKDLLKERKEKIDKIIGKWKKK